MLRFKYFLGLCCLVSAGLSYAADDADPDATRPVDTFSSLAGLSAASCEAGRTDSRCQRSLQETRFLSSYVIGLSAGPVWGGGGRTQVLTIEPEIVKTYRANSTQNDLFSGELFVGKHRQMGSRLEVQYGLAAVVTSSAGFSGAIWDDESETFDNYTYQYHAQHAHLAVKVKCLANFGYDYRPYISGSVGAGFNRSYDYSSTSTLAEAVPMPAFRSDTQTAFTYNVGLGVAKTWKENFQFAVGYEFSDWGQGHLSRGVGQVTGSGVSFNHYLTSGIMFNVSYLV